MIRQPRTARAPTACRRDNMTPLYTFRLFIISMIIATTIIESPVSANAINRRKRQETQIPEDDAIAEESIRDEFRNDSTTVNAVSEAAKQIATTTSAKVYEIKGEPSVEDKVELTTAFILLKTDDGYLKITGLPIYTSSVKDTEPISSQETTRLPGSTNSLKEKINDGTVSIEELTTALASDFTSTIQHNTKTRSSDVTTQEAPIEITIDATALDNQTKSEDSTLSETKSTEPISLTTGESIDTSSLSDITTDDATVGTSRASTTSNQESETKQNEQNTPTPSWKKYTTIDRKRLVPQMSTSSTEQDIQTMPTRISLEQLLTDTSISSLGQLGESLSSKTTYAFDVPSTSPFVQEIVSVTPDEITTSSTMTSQGTSPKSLQITSKRAGFLDYSAKPVAEEATTIIENYDIPDKFNESRGFSSMFEFEPDNDPVPENKNKTDVASQSQLAEDVMREEMMKEEMMNNEEENANRYREVDQLSVKPIEKNSLYSVGPNYKPMKKLDVQAAKPFLRNPDDLSWRNESISSLGIVFKAKPAAKNFTEVLKNKTESLFNIVNDKDSKNDLPDLRERLEKIAEVRKSKKKKVIDKFGETIYTDYEETSNSAETTSASTTTTTTTTLSTTLSTTKAFETAETTITDEPDVTTHVPVKHVYESTPYLETTEIGTTKPPSKLTISDYYDGADDYESDYLNLPKIELKKFTTRLTSQHTPTTTSSFATSPFQKPSTFYWPDRKPTLQYFPPRPNNPKINVQGLDDNPVNKLNYYTLKDTTKNLIPVAVRYTTLPATPVQVFGQKNRQTTPLNNYKNELTKTVYYTQPKVMAVPVAVPVHGYEDDGRYNRPTYVIKHFKDLVEKASKNDDEKDYDLEYTPTQSPGRETTIADLMKNTPKINLGEDYEYDTGFRKDVINRFVDNFNQNSERFKVDFPILYNNSVVHRKENDANDWATSSAFMKRLYEDMSGSKAARGRDCEGCDRNVDLPPEYELHYYVPEQEEREEAESRSHSVYKYLWEPHSQR